MVKLNHDYQWQIQIFLMNLLLGVEILLPLVDNDCHKLMFAKYPGDENCVYMLLTTLSIELIFWTSGA
ncbi:hypothetical protein Pint_07226 [Pistacia integerrima]|uniref:Uncharacterized protein n=1 Tax=Pistacia integerrima TaxID=434235 RepID=A0ACC0XX36_9ROSI|nr:hypothetical protein Pint_07226 [Pistacia integerrima]